MKVDKIEEILSKNGVEHSKELSIALEEILDIYSRDRNLAKNVSKNISRDNKLSDILHGKK